MNAWDRLGVVLAATKPRLTRRRTAAERYARYLARSEAVGAEPWLTPWTGPAAPAGADTVALPLIRWAPAGADSVLDGPVNDPARPWLPVNDPARPWLASC